MVGSQGTDSRGPEGSRRRASGARGAAAREFRPGSATRALIGAIVIAAPALIGLAIAVSPPSHADPLSPTDNVRIDSGQGISSYPSIAADRWGRVHAVWQDDRTGPSAIFYSRSTDSGRAWEADRRIDNVPTGAPGYEPDVAVDQTGGAFNRSVYVVWRTTAMGAGDVWLVRSADGGTTWATAVLLDGGPATAATYRPKVTVGSDGRVFVIWSDNRDGSTLQAFVRSSADGGTTWTGETRLSDPGSSNLRPKVVAAGPYTYAAWIQTDLVSRYAIDIAASPDNGATWTKAEALSRVVPDLVRDYDVAVDPEGRLEVAWIDVSASGGLQSLQYARSDDLGRSLGPVSIVTASSAPFAEVRLADLGPATAVVWSEADSGDYDIYYAATTGGPWSSPVRVDDTDRNANPADDATTQDRPAVAGAGAGLYVAWTDARNGGLTDIYGSVVEWSRLLITEVQDSPDGGESVELYAWSGSPILAAGWSLDVDGTRYDLSGLGTVRPGTYVTVGDSAGATLRVPLDINDEGSMAALFDGTGVPGDAIGFGQRGVAPDPAPGGSTARFWSGSAYGRSWTLGRPPTPGAPNAAPSPLFGSPVVLNEVMFNPTDPSSAFIELYFRGTAATTVPGLVLHGDVSFALPPIDFSPTVRWYDVFPSTAPGLFASLGPSGDNVYLMDTGGHLWDEVGWSSPHLKDRSMARVPEGAGTRDGYDDSSSYAAGWRFDLAPTVAGILIGPDQTQIADLGSTVRYAVNVTSALRSPEDVEIETASGPVGWRASVFAADGVTPLPDSNGNGIPDLPALAPSETRGIVVAVDVPGIPPIGDTEVTVVSGFGFSNPMVRGTASLSTDTVPHVEPRKSASPTTIYAEGSPPPFVTTSTVHLKITGSGRAIEQTFPQDTVFIVDSSGSMGVPPWNSDPTGMRIDAIKGYIDGMKVTDRAAIVGFGYDPDYGVDYGAWLTNDVRGGRPTHLAWMNAQGKATAKDNAETMRFANGGTNIEKALQIAHEELLPTYRPTLACIDYARPFPSPAGGGIPGHTWVEILLTDGLPSHSTSCTVDEVIVAAQNHVRIFTIGLGDFVDETYLRDIASRTGGQYFKANTAADLAAVYDAIGTIVNRIAGYDDNVNDDLPMVYDVVPPFVDIVAGSFRDPATGNPRPPDFQGTVWGAHVLQWNVSELDIGQVWTVEYDVATTRTGRVPVSQYPDARVAYLRWDARRVTLPFPPLEITVLQAPSQATYTITRNPARGYVLVDHVAYPVPAGFTWAPGDVHDLEVPEADSFGPSERDAFDRWDDGGASTHPIIVGAQDTTITAYLITQFRPQVDLIGTDTAHGVAARYMALRTATTAPGRSGAWTDWVDAGSALAFDRLASGSDASRRWVTREDFAAPPWAYVTTGFSRSVVYYAQAMAVVRTTGLAPTAPALVAWTAFGDPGTAPTSDAWTDWVDVGAPLSIENPVQVSPVERYASAGTTGWIVSTPLDVQVDYVRQWAVHLILHGLAPVHPATVRSMRFASEVATASSGEWSDWVDHGAGLSVDALITVGARERYTARAATSWQILAAATLVVDYVHQYRPMVVLVGTDEDHSVSVSMGGGVPEAGVSGTWTEWVDGGSAIEFSASTTGTPPRQALDPTSFSADRAFDATIRYAPAQPNFKPLVALVYVIGILGVGAAVAYRRPIDLYLLPSEARQRRSSLRDFANFRVLPKEDRTLKARRDRRFTFLSVSLPFGAVEGAIGLLSFFTGILRVPDGGSWVCLGLLLNTLLLLCAFAGDAGAHRWGYRPPRPQAASRARH